MEVSIKIEDYLSEDEIKEIAKEQIAYAIREKFRKKVILSVSSQIYHMSFYSRLLVSQLEKMLLRRLKVK